MAKKQYYYNPYRRKKPSWGRFWGILFLLVVLTNGLGGSEMAALLFLTGVGGGCLYGGYRLTTRQSRLEKHNTALRLQDLKESIGRVDRQVKLLDTYLAEKAYTQYGVLARQVLPQIASITEEAQNLKKYMDLAIYKRINKKAESLTVDIVQQLKLLDLPSEMAPEPETDEEARIAKIAPEILTSYQNIQRDHKTILEKIKTTDNQAELLALHETNMKRFEDILSGYLKIKEMPKNFHNADERLELAKLALEKFDLELDQTLRELNESDLADFEVSLRMMTKQTHDPLADSTLD